MKQHLLRSIALTFLLPFIAHAQDMAYLACHYAESYKKNLMKPDRVYQDEMVLRIGKHSSEFYSLWNREHQRVRDSVSAKGGGVAEMLAVKDKVKYPTSTETEVIYKGYPNQGNLTVIRKVFSTWYQYTEPQLIPQWTIKAEKKEIAGYACQKATTTFYGRNWTAWFTADIPVQDGPWKLCGLPGLILEAEDSDGHYAFKCMEIKRLNEGVPISIPSKKYIKCNKAQFFKEVEGYYNNMLAYIRSKGSYIERMDGNRSKEPTAKYNNIER